MAAMLADVEVGMRCAVNDVMKAITVRRVEAIGAQELAGLTRVLIDCVEGGASVSFMWPMTTAKADAYWAGVDASLKRHERILLVAETSEGGIVGTVQVLLNLPENQPHRGDLAKLLVARSARGAGIGAALLAAAEKAAVDAGRTLLVLDTVTGSPAERIYVRHGWQRCGEIPEYALWPDGRPCPTTIFYKFVGK